MPLVSYLAPWKLLQLKAAIDLQKDDGDTESIQRAQKPPEMYNCSPRPSNYKSARSSFETSFPGTVDHVQAGGMWGTPSPPDSMNYCALARCSSCSSCSSSHRPPALSLSTSLSERQGGKLFSFSACSTPASNYVFRSLSCCEFERGPRRILIVVDATKDVNTEPLQWTLAHVAEPGDFVTFLGLLPWLTFPMGVKQWSKLQRLTGSEATEPEFRSMQQLFNARGVHLDIRIKSGFPRRDIVSELARELDAKWIIFYRWMSKSPRYFTKKLGKRKNIVFLKSKNEGNVSFASKSGTQKMQATTAHSNDGKRKKLAQWLTMSKRITDSRAQSVSVHPSFLPESKL